jgi:acylphosphatase
VNQGLIRKRVTVHGRVQGVFFRDSVRQRADSRGVSGWVTNSPDGAVEAVFEGKPDAVDELVRFCQSGPRGADVDRVDVQDEELAGLEGFQVR